LAVREAAANLEVHEGRTFNYISTRNHAFTNRDQKGRIVVTANAAFVQVATADAADYTVLQSPNGQAFITFYPDPIALTTGS